jgi:hypothetical protein
MLQHKGITSSALLLLVSFSLLIIPWPGLPEAYSSVYCAVGTTLFGNAGQGISVSLRAKETPDGRIDTEIHLRSSNPPGGTFAPHNARSGYVALAELIALVIATPVSWSRRMKALVAGVVLVNLFVLFRLGVVVLEGLVACPVWTIIELGTSGSMVLRATVEVVAKSPTLSFVIPALIWMLVTLRRGDVDTLMARLRPADAPPDK